MRNQIELACRSHAGYIRRNNEDNFYFCGKILPEEHGSMERPFTMLCSDEIPAVAGVFDGMGGASRGERASFLAASVLMDSLSGPMASAETENVPLDQLAHRMNHRVAQEAESSFCNMGSTAVMMSFHRGEFSLCNVGDSRGFLLRYRELGQLTRDHTDREYLQRSGCTNRKPALTQYIGVPETEFCIEPYLCRGNILDGDRFLICSDGLTDMVSVEEIEYIMCTAAGAEACVEQLMEAALQHGGRDNITVVVSYVHAE